MTLRSAALTSSVFLAALLGSCDPIFFASATTPLVAPVDSTCLRQALTERLGLPTQPPLVTARTPARPASLSFLYGSTSITQIYPDSGYVTLHASEPDGWASSPSRATKDSVSHRLGRTLLAVRDACGGVSPVDRPELTFANGRS